MYFFAVVFWWCTTIRREVFLGLEGQLGDLLPPELPLEPAEEVILAEAEALRLIQDFLRFLGNTGRGITCNKYALSGSIQYIPKLYQKYSEVCRSI